MKGDTDMKPIREKDLRLYQQVTNLDDDLILEAMAEPVTPPARRVRGQRAEAIQRFFAHPMVASLAVSTVILSVLVAVLLATGAFDTPTVIDPPAHGSYPEETYPPELPQMPTAEGAASLHKGMSVADMEALLGKNYTVEDGQYTFTLDTGEKLTVSTSPDTSLLSGFIWQGDTAKAVNPMNIPEDILEKIQEYAADKVVPVYTMVSLFNKYKKRDLPTVDEVLEGAEIRYLRMSADGRITVTDEEGQNTEDNLQGGGFTFLEEISALFDESVRVKAYYPILTSRERGAVYFKTSVGDYILYLHGEGLPLIPEGGDVFEDTVPYLMPVITFHEFAYGMVDKGAMLGVGWDFTEDRMAIIEPYKIGGEGYQKPVNRATPEAAAEVKEGMLLPFYELGTCLRCAAENTISLSSYARTTIALPTYNKGAGLHYWELTDGTCLVINCIQTYDATLSSGPYRLWVSDVMMLGSVEQAEAFGTPSLANYELLYEGMSRNLAYAIMGDTTTDFASSHTEQYWGWAENEKTHIVTVSWKSVLWDQIPYNNVYKNIAKSFVYESRDIIQGAEEIELGMSFAAIMARVGNCLCGHTKDGSRSGYHYWEIPDGRCLAVYVGLDIPATSDAFEPVFSVHYNQSAMHVLWLDDVEGRESVGTPSLHHAQSIYYDLEQEVVLALMGQPKVTVGPWVSMWEWTEEGKTYTCTVYWKENAPAGLYDHFGTVIKCEVTEGKISSLPIPEKTPTPDETSQIREGMKASELLKALGTPDLHEPLGPSILCGWIMTDGRVFCAVLENDVTETQITEPAVTYTFSRDSEEDVMIASVENVEEIREGMSSAVVYALLGTTEQYNYMEDTHTWITPIGVWWELTVQWETIRHPESGITRRYVASFTLGK